MLEQAEHGGWRALLVAGPPRRRHIAPRLCPVGALTKRVGADDARGLHPRDQVVCQCLSELWGDEGVQQLDDAGEAADEGDVVQPLLHLTARRRRRLRRCRRCRVWQRHADLVKDGR